MIVEKCRDLRETVVNGHTFARGSTGPCWGWLSHPLLWQPIRSSDSDQNWPVETQCQQGMGGFLGAFVPNYVWLSLPGRCKDANTETRAAVLCQADVMSPKGVCLQHCINFSVDVLWWGTSGTNQLACTSVDVILAHMSHFHFANSSLCCHTVSSVKFLTRIGTIFYIFWGLKSFNRLVK